MRKRIAYGKLGRVVELSSDKWGESGGDNEPAKMLLDLAERHPEVDWVMLGRNRGWVPPRDNIINPWQDWTPYIRERASTLYRVEDQSIETYYKTITFYDDLVGPAWEEVDGVLLWGGQHGTSNSPIPKVEDRSVYTKAQISMVNYSSHIIRGVNRWRRDDPIGREEVWLMPDVRNYVKGRDLKWPRRHPVLSQFDFKRQQLVERYGDPRTPEECGFLPEDGVSTPRPGTWTGTDRYAASGLELVGIPDPAPYDQLVPYECRMRFGIVINEARNYGMRPELTRLHAMQHYVKPNDPDWVYGTWSPKSLETLSMRIKPQPYGQIFESMLATKSTFTTPSSGSGWATAKPWEAFSVGAVCFFHPHYDTQGHILPTLEQAAGRDDEWAALAQWLRVKTPEDLRKRIDAVNTSKETYEWLAGAQYRLLTKELEDRRCHRMIEERLGLS